MKRDGEEEEEEAELSLDDDGVVLVGGDGPTGLCSQIPGRSFPTIVVDR